MNKKSIQITTFFIFCVLLITGCAGLFKKPTLSPDAISPGFLRHRVEQNYLRFHSAKAKARISLESPQMNFMANSSIVIRSPDSLLVKLSAAFGLGIGSLFFNKEQFVVHNSFENIVYIAHPDSVDLRHFLVIDFNFHDMIQAFSGIHLIKTHDRDSLSIDRNQYLLIGQKGEQVLKYWIDPKNFVVTEHQQLDKQGRVLLHFQYSQFTKYGRVVLPKTIRISQPDKKTRITIAFSRIDVNVPVNHQDFELKIPQNAQLIIL
ncbi:MAG: DUF4292 domain-containing protein [bacterium]|nr:DUF4292 domain-containing protein [bacterium]